VLHAWRTTLPHGEDASNRFVGPPLSRAFHAHARIDEHAHENERALARARLGFDAHRPLLIVLGGSQGSSALNSFVRTHATVLLGNGVQILHQTGPKKSNEALGSCAGYRAVEYVDPVHEALRGTTVALVRGGASTLAEIAAMRVPAFVAPYPGHADQHQRLNALELGEGVRIVADTELNASARDALLHLASAEVRRERASMSAALARAVPTDAAVRIWEHIAEVAAQGTA
jgi:UDP-N-acetylglucosamine--N-acetylmuramyl-(pentapeptide) pyrophosphoryl-undecaprenol N-acetylglucosamine transferase